ncbi:MAG: cupin [Chromatiales bacterium]|jgi:mannose-6-phosphate isomerase-like protein (cupin superfamily)|nr:cupin [Chromatiales bacterium]
MDSDSGWTFNLDSTYLRLRSDVSVEPLPVDGSFWRDMASGNLGTFHDEYLVSTHTYETDWNQWEMHPYGDEVVVLLSGAINVLFQVDIGMRRTSLEKTGTFIIVPRGTWHTAEVLEPSTALFITAGEGTQHRAIE